MSRFQQTTYRKVLKEPRKRYLLKNKEKRLWKHQDFKEHLKMWAFLLFWLGGAIVLMVTVGWIWLFLGYAFLFPVLAGGYFIDKREKLRKSKSPISLNEFINRAKNLNNISNVYIRATRYVLGNLYQINACQIYPKDTPGALFKLSERMSRPPFAFAVVLGVANRLSIPLSEEDVDQIIDNICNCENVEELIGKLSNELEHRRGRNCQNAIDFTQPPTDDPKESVWKYVFIGFLLFGLFAIQGLVERSESIKDVMDTAAIIAVLLTALIGAFLGLAFGIWKNKKPKKTKKLSVRQCIIRGCILLGILALIGLVGQEAPSITDILLGFLFFLGLGGLLGWGYGALMNWEPKKGSKENEISLDSIRILAKHALANKYIKFLLTSIPIGQDVKIHESEPLPEIKGTDLERMPFFSEICMCLKDILELDDRFYEQPVEVEYNFCIKNEQNQPEEHLFTITICDGIENAYIIFRRHDHNESEIEA